MSKDDPADDDYEKAWREIVHDRIEEVFARQPADYRQGLEEIGFTWHDDDGPSEEDEERLAVPMNANQRRLVEYFEGKTLLADGHLTALREEWEAETPNYPLIRKYFRSGNQPLRELILAGLQRQPTDLGWLCNLAAFHEYTPMLAEVIRYFTDACQREEDWQHFAEIAQEFHLNTAPDGYDAFLALRELFGPDSEKGKIVDFLSREFAAQQQSLTVF